MHFRFSVTRCRNFSQSFPRRLVWGLSWHGGLMSAFQDQERSSLQIEIDAIEGDNRKSLTSPFRSFLRHLSAVCLLPESREHYILEKKKKKGEKKVLKIIGGREKKVKTRGLGDHLSMHTHTRKHTLVSLSWSSLKSICMLHTSVHPDGGSVFVSLSVYVCVYSCNMTIMRTGISF